MILTMPQEPIEAQSCDQLLIIRQYESDQPRIGTTRTQANVPCQTEVTDVPDAWSMEHRGSSMQEDARRAKELQTNACLHMYCLMRLLFSALCSALSVNENMKIAIPLSRLCALSVGFPFRFSFCYVASSFVAALRLLAVGLGRVMSCLCVGVHACSVVLSSMNENLHDMLFTLSCLFVSNFR